MQATGQIGAVVLGLGRMGTLGLAAAADLPEIRLLAGVDPDDQAREAANRLLKRLGLEGVYLTDNIANLHTLAHLLQHNDLLVYEAAPPSARAGNLRRLRKLLPPRSVILAEKPLVLSATELAEVLENGHLILGEFIEIENPALKFLFNRLAKKGQRAIRRLTFWRGSPTIGRRRPGVQGGSLLDKGIHDLAIVHALMKPNLEETRIVQARALGNIGPDDVAFYLELGLTSHYCQETRVQILSSWDGPTQTPEERLITELINDSGVVHLQNLHGRQGEIRVGIIEFDDETLIIDLLQPRVWDQHGLCFQQNASDYETAKRQSLARIMERAVSSLRRGQADQLLGPDAIRWVHSIIFEARSRALQAASIF